MQRSVRLVARPEHYIERTQCNTVDDGVMLQYGGRVHAGVHVARFSRTFGIIDQSDTQLIWLVVAKHASTARPVVNVAAVFPWNVRNAYDFKTCSVCHIGFYILKQH